MKNLKFLRIQKSLTQSQLGKIVNVNQTAIGKYERGELQPNIETLNKLADFFGCTTDYLIGREDDFSNVQTNSDLSNEEREILAIYNSLKPSNKQFFLEFARRMNVPLSIEQLNSNTIKGQF